MKNILEKLYSGISLTLLEAEELIPMLVSAEAEPVQVGAALAAIRVRGVTATELLGFKNALLKLCKQLHFNVPVMDICGTGGDGKDTFNISTLTAFVLAAAGVKVAKHGNVAVSSSCGSSNVLEAIGLKFTDDQTKLQGMLDETNLCFLHAPLFHPAMKSVGLVRKALGTKTFFNLLGPLVNPAQPKFQYNGVYSFEFLRLYSQVLDSSGIDYLVVYSLDGYDEISLTGSWKIVGRSEDKLIAPGDLDLPILDPKELAGGDTVADSAAVFLKILAGKGTDSQNAVVSINAATALGIVEKSSDLKERYQRCLELLKSGAAEKVLFSLKDFN